MELTDTVSYTASNNKISQNSENFFSFLAAQSLSPAFAVSEFLRLSKMYRVGYSVITNIIFFSLHNRSAGNFSKLLRGLFMQTRSEVLLSFWFFILASSKLAIHLLYIHVPYYFELASRSKSPNGFPMRFASIKTIKSFSNKITSFDIIQHV